MLIELDVVKEIAHTAIWKVTIWDDQLIEASRAFTEEFWKDIQALISNFVVGYV
jgi:hypothetical protein